MELIPIDRAPCVMRARISDEQLDTPIRRIFPLWLLQRTIRLKLLTLVSPREWEDPHEDQAAWCMMQRMGDATADRPFRQQALAPYLATAWAQCWSLNPGSDTLLRAYSRVIIDPVESRNTDPRNEGVIVTSTPRLLAAAMGKWAAKRADSHFVIGRVTYKSEVQIGQDIVNIVNGQAGPLFFRSVQGRAESLLWKRDYFQHEDEVRLLCLLREGISADKFREFPIDPNEVFTEVRFDPRLVEFERKEREAEVRCLGYEGPIVRDLSYQKILYQLDMRRDWPDP